MTVLYVALNAVFLYTTPIAKLAGQLDVGLIAGKQIFGDAGGRIVGGADLHRPRLGRQRHDVDRAEGDHGHGRGLAAAVGVRAQDPERRAGVAILLQARRRHRSCCGRRRSKSVVKFVQFSLTFCSFLAVLGVIVLRYTQARAAAPLSRVGLPAAAAPFSRHVALHDDLSLARAAAWRRSSGVAIMLTGLVIYLVSWIVSPAPKAKTS